MSCNITFIGGPMHGKQEYMHEPYPPVYNVPIYQDPGRRDSSCSETHPPEGSRNHFVYKRLLLWADDCVTVVYIPQAAKPSRLLEYIVQCLKSIK